MSSILRTEHPITHEAGGNPLDVSVN